MTRRASHAWIPFTIALAVALAACPAPTGRRRGIVDGAGAVCTPGVEPVSGTQCINEGEQCSANTSCGNGGFTTVLCSCQSNVWQCDTMTVCQVPLIDAGQVSCPATIVMDHDPCTARQGGLLCRGVVPACDGRPMQTDCWCTGSHFSCPPVDCENDGGDSSTGDASNVLCPATTPRFGDTCMPGVQCAYAEPTGCPTVCDCGTDGTFSCQFDCSVDAGPYDSGVDASFDF